MNDTVEFKAWPKIERLNKQFKVIITEKYDGTNACVIVRDGEVIACQSRNKLIYPGEDNFGFASWAYDNAERLAKLGDGYHFGEWCGPGIQGNPLNLQHKKFFLFSWYRQDQDVHTADDLGFVPVLYEGKFSDSIIHQVMTDLKENAESKGYKPEGVIIYYPDLKRNFKHTFENQQGKYLGG